MYPWPHERFPRPTGPPPRLHYKRMGVHHPQDLRQNPFPGPCAPRYRLPHHQQQGGIRHEWATLPPPPPPPPSRHGRQRHERQPVRHVGRYFNKEKSDSTNKRVVQESSEATQERLIAMQPSYVQCTQHTNYYQRGQSESSSVKASKRLCDLYQVFEKELATRHVNLWVPNDYIKFQKTESDDQYLSKNLKEQAELCTLEHKSLARHKKIRAVMLIRKLQKEAKDSGLSLLEYISTDGSSLPMFALPKLKETLRNGESSLNDSSILGCEPEEDEFSTDKAGELITSIRKLKEHDKRLHDELWYNDPQQVNDGPLCRCSEIAKKKGIRHHVYPGEKPPLSSDPLENNPKKLYNYLVMISPTVNFTSDQPTRIRYDGRDYVFEGFSILSSEPLENLPFCDIIRFHTRYTIYLVKESVPENFCAKGLQLFSEYFFRDVLELYDWFDMECHWSADTETKMHRKFFFFPRFVRSLPDDGKEILAICEVLKYLLYSNKPLISEADMRGVVRYGDHETWLRFTGEVRGMIVTNPGWKPSSLRVDQLDRYNRSAVENTKAQKRTQNSYYPLLVHFGIRPANLSYAGDPQYQKVWKSYLKQRHLMANAPIVKPADKAKLKNREEALQEMRRTKVLQREVTVELSSEGFMRTGIYSDMCQHALLLPVLTHHLRYQLCLATLEKRIGYIFKDRKWLSHAMNHPSCQMNYGPNPDHVRNALSNCGLRQPTYGDSSIHYKYTRKRGITTLIRIMARLGQERPVLSPIEHNERLEFLGDAVIGYLTSIHLFFMFPELSEGALTTFRTALVNNQHLAQLAERLHLDEYMVYAHGPDLCRNDDLRHAMANCFEALMGAIYMEAGLETAQKLLTKFLWDDETLQDIWINMPKHPLQEEEPESDRHFIPNVPILKRMQKFEEVIGVEFNHIRLLAKAFTWRNVHENVLTHGHNQRLEFLGDSICNLVSSTYLFELYPTHHEGHLTLLRSTMVNGRTQSLVAAELGMPGYVISSMSPDASKLKGPDWREKNLADLLEAFVASLYIDKGLEFVEGFMKVGLQNQSY